MYVVTLTRRVKVLSLLALNAWSNTGGSIDWFIILPEPILWQIFHPVSSEAQTIKSTFPPQTKARPRVLTIKPSD